jgi:alpha-tubulin suppressor-like RCC1 family protein
VVAVAAGPYHTLALRGDGTVWAWGWNYFGQLGDASTVDKRAPVQVPGLTGITAIAAGAYHSLALKGDGTVVAWGWNGYGALGDGTVSTRVRPTRVVGLGGVVSISAGLLHNLALREDGTGWAWGFNALGQLGDGTTTDRHVPVQLPPNYNNYAYVSLNAGWLHSLSRDALGAGNTWGYNNVGQVAGGGQGGFTTTPGTSTITGMEESAGGYHNFKVQRDGTVSPSGWDGLGQLGNGPGGSVKGLSLLSSISAGGYHSLAVTTDRQLWAWGWNYFGQLGTGAAGDADVPQKVTGVLNAVVVGAGAYDSIAIQG